MKLLQIKYGGIALEKERIDILLVEKGFFETREKARASIMAGVIFVNGNKEVKAGTKVPKDAEIFVKENVIPYVSRGGLKLEKALNSFPISLQDKKCIDIGSSTGGFTDCMLKNGASKVFAVDVGYGQLAWVLRNDPRVVCMERTNIRYVKNEDIGELLDFASIDVSFISLKKVLPVAGMLLGENGEIVCLIKPQFEAGREKVGKHGVVREPETHIEVITMIVNFVKEMGLLVCGLTYSPIKGPEGNIEYLLHVKKQSDSVFESDSENIKKIVMEAHNLL